ncbi:MAG: hypothetical protein F7C82_03860 [Desulfurococcales archaeon]|nr:hypothetical protein [Desulfurococcales archaeon]
MARLVLVEGMGPLRFKLEDGSTISICTCGLSRTFPLCSGKHVMIQDEKPESVYVYDDGYNRLGIVDQITTLDGKKISPTIIKKLRYTRGQV